METARTREQIRSKEEEVAAHSSERQKMDSAVEATKKRIFSLRQKQGDAAGALHQKLMAAQGSLEDAQRLAKSVDLETEAFTASLPPDILKILRERWGENLSQEATKTKWAREADATGSDIP